MTKIPKDTMHSYYGRMNNEPISSLSEKTEHRIKIMLQELKEEILVEMRALWQPYRDTCPTFKSTSPRSTKKSIASSKADC